MAAYIFAPPLHRFQCKCLWGSVKPLHQHQLTYGDVKQPLTCGITLYLHNQLRSQQTVLIFSVNNHERGVPGEEEAGVLDSLHNHSTTTNGKGWISGRPATSYVSISVKKQTFSHYKD